MQVAELQSKVARREASIEKLTKTRATFEKQVTRLVEERDTHIRLYKDLLAVKSEGELIQHLQPKMKYSEEEDVQLEIAMKLSKVEGLERDKEMMAQDIRDLQADIVAWKLEVQKIIIYLCHQIIHIWY